MIIYLQGIENVSDDDENDNDNYNNNDNNILH
jgi:hypothetical protein